MLNSTVQANHLPLLLLISLLPRAGAQPAGKTEPLDIKPGLWELTSTSHVHSELPAGMFASYTPEQKAKVLASIKAQEDKGTTQKKNICITRQNIDSGDILNDQGGCPKQMTSSAAKLQIVLTCNQIDRTLHFERIDAGNFSGASEQIMHDANHSSVRQTLAAKWIRDGCATTTEDLVAAGLNRELLEFAPHRQGGWLNRYFQYLWAGTKLMIGYMGGMPGGPGGGMAEVYLHGTDGQFLYVTIDSDVCATDAPRYKIDKSGVVTRIASLPKGLRAGKDQAWGPPCQK